MDRDLSQVKALTFDVFGTVVDWRSTIMAEGAVLNRRRGLPTSWDELADAWRAAPRGLPARRYKPDPQVYRLAVDLLRLQPHEIMLVAAHNSDLEAAAAVGLRTAFVARPLEFGPHGKAEVQAGPFVDIAASDFHELAVRLGA